MGETEGRIDAIEEIMRDVMESSRPRWRPSHLSVHRLSDITRDWGDIRHGSAQFGQADQRRIALGDILGGIGAFDVEGKPYWRVTYSTEYWRLGLAETPAIYWDPESGCVVEGETISTNSITYDKMLIPSGPYNYLRDGTFVQSGGTWQSAEVDSLGIELIGIITQDVGEASDILEDRAGILFRPVNYDYSSYTELDQYKLAMGSDGPEIWAYSEPELRLCDLNFTGTYGADAWVAIYGSNGCSWRPDLNRGDRLTLSIYSDESNASARLSLYDSFNSASSIVALDPESVTLKIGPTLEEKSALQAREDGVLVRNYIGFLSEYESTTTPPIGSIVFNRPTNDYLKWWDGSNYRRILDSPLTLAGHTQKTIASGEIDVTGLHYVRVDTEGSASTDDLDTITGGVVGQILVIQANSATRDVVVKHATGNIRLNGSTDFTLNHFNDKLLLIHSANKLWCEIGRGDNGI